MNSPGLNSDISIILPARNEGDSLAELIPRLKSDCPAAEIIVVNDGSEDNTQSVCESHGIHVIKHPRNLGNGAAIKAGARAAKGDILVFMDADGQHDPACIARLLQELDNGYDMVVGGRDRKSNSSLLRYLGNQFYNKLASWMTGHKITDLTSGFRAVKKDRFLEFVNILPNGFSYPTTITMAFLRSGYAVQFISINVKKDRGESHISLIKDGIKFCLIIFRIAVLYSPLKIFFPASVIMFCTGLGYYLYTYISDGRFTNMGILLFITSVLIFLIGLVSEQITFLIYLDKKK